jgi:hypothetical protein
VWLHADKDVYRCALVDSDTAPILPIAGGLRCGPRLPRSAELGTSHSGVADTVLLRGPKYHEKAQILILGVAPRQSAGATTRSS